MTSNANSQDRGHLASIQQEPRLSRDNLVRTLEALLSGDVETVIVWGQDGIGKTTLLKQFEVFRKDSVFALYISAASRFAYDPQQIASELYSQVETRLSGSEPSSVSGDPVELGKLFIRLRRRAERDKCVFYFILDGVDELPEGEDSTAREILNLLPFGVASQFRFLISASSPAALPIDPAARRGGKEWIVPFLSHEAVARYLEGIPLNETQLEAIAQITKGIPGQLAIVRRLLLATDDVDKLIEQLPDEAPELFRLQWASIDRGNRTLMLCLAILANEHRSFTSEELASLIGTTHEGVSTLLERVGFVRMDDSGKWQFLTQYDRRFAGAELAEYRRDVNDLFIKNLLQDPESPGALWDLPTYFTSANRLKDLVEYLSPPRFARIFETASSLSDVQRQADRGMEAARQLGQDGDLVRFALQKSAIQEMAQSQTAVSEVRAMSFLDDVETAVALSESASRIEVRFRLLVAIARARKEKGAPEDPALLMRIRALFDEIDPATLGDQRISAAQDLLYTLPDLAVDLVSRTSGVNESENSMDWAIARLVIQAQFAQDDPNAKQRVQRLNDAIQDPGLKRLSTVATLLLGRLDASDAITRAESLEGTSDKLFVLQHWMQGNPTSSDTTQVLEYALRVALQSKDYAVNASVYRRLATCMPHLQSQQEAHFYVQQFDAQRGVLEHIGPSGEFYRLQLLLAQTEMRYEPELGRQRFNDIYNGTQKISDPVEHTTVVAHLAAALAETDPAKLADSALQELVEHELRDGVDKIFRLSADHREAVRGVIDALAVAMPESALEIIEQMNTEWRRDSAYQEFVEAALYAPPEMLQPSAIGKALDRIVDPAIFDESASTVIFTLSRRGFDGDAVPFGSVASLLKRSVRIHSALTRARACAQLAGSLAHSKHQDAVDQFIKELASAWTSIGESWKKIDTGAEIIASLAPTLPDEARRYVTQYNEVKAKITSPDAETVSAGLLGILLAIRAFAGLVQYQISDINRDEERLLSAIERCGAVDDQSFLLSTLALRYYFAGAKDRCENIVTSRLTELLHSLSSEDSAYEESTIVEVAPALFLGAPGIAATFLGKLSLIRRDQAYWLIAQTLLTKTPPGDAFDRAGKLGYDVSYEDANKILDLMRNMESDSEIYSLILSLVDSADPQRNAERFSRPQRAELARQLDEIARAKFPNSRFIQHDGFLISAQANINRLRDRSSAIPVDQLASRAHLIPNVSDRGLVLSYVALTLRDARDRARYLDDAFRVIDSIPMLLDRIDRYLHIGETLVTIDAHRGKEMLKRAQQLMAQGEGASTIERRRSLIQTAYRIDPDYAASLASAFNDDPAKKRVKRQMELYQLADSLTSQSNAGPAMSPRRAYDLSKAAWIKLGQLNAGRTFLVPPERALSQLQYAAPQPISLAYPIFAWFIENAVRRMAHGTPTVRQYVLPLFEACLHGAETAVSTGYRNERHVHRSLNLGANVDDRIDLKMIRDGHRAEAVDAFADWIRTIEGESILVVDPYFGPDSIELLKLVQGESPAAEIEILSGTESLKGVARPYEDSYRSAWRQISADAPPYARFTFIGTRGAGKCPIHDRWWLSGTSGLQLGTSFNGFGSRLSSVRILTSDEVQAVRSEVEPFVTRRRTLFEGERLEYLGFTI
jgi:hypothetical protein